MRFELDQTFIDTLNKLNLRWMRERITRMWPQWVAAAKQFTAEGSLRRKHHVKKVVISWESSIEIRVLGHSKNLGLHFQGNDFILQRETIARDKLTKTLFLTLSIDFYFLWHVCLSTHVAGYGFHRCPSGRDGSVERSGSGVVHIRTWGDTLRELHYVPEVSLSWTISVQF